MNKLYYFIKAKSTLKGVFIGLFLIVLFNTFLLPILPSMLWGYQIPINEILDLKFSYNFEQCYLLFDNLGIDGRNSYLKSTLFIDTPYAVIYSFTYAIILFRLLKLNDLLKYKALVFFPFVIGLFDMLENFSISTLLYNYPLIMKTLVMYSSLFTSIKWIFAMLVFLFVLSNIFIFALNKIKVTLKNKN